MKILNGSKSELFLRDELCEKTTAFSNYSGSSRFLLL